MLDLNDSFLQESNWLWHMDEFWKYQIYSYLATHESVVALHFYVLPETSVEIIVFNNRYVGVWYFLHPHRLGMQCEV
jgi:hypothetical protein